MALPWHGTLSAQDAAPPAAAAPTATPAGQDSFVLEFREEPGGNTVDMRGFLRVLDQIFSDLQSRWDPLQGILEIKAEGRVIQALSRQPLVIIDTRMNKVKRPIRVNAQGEVSIPVETVSLVLKSLGIAFDMGAEGKEPGGKNPAAPADESTTAPLAPAAPAVPSIPLGQSTAATSSGPTTTTASRAPAIDLARLTGPSASATPEATAPAGLDDVTPLPVIEVRPETETALDATPVTPSEGDGADAPSVPGAPAGQTASPSVPLTQQGRLPLQVPTRQEQAPGQATAIEAPTVLAGRIGLTWGQLADLNHRQPPRRITLVCDTPLEPVVRAIDANLRTDLDVEVTIVIAPGARRDSEGLLSNVVLSQPDLLVDLLAVPPEAETETEQEQPYYVWVVHEALWPQDRKLEGEARGMAQNYRRHQFQSLALGSRLRTELGQEFSGRVIFYELAPSYLLRRTDAPSAEVLIPRASGQAASNVDDRLARAIAGAIRTYIHGMEAVRF